MREVFGAPPPYIESPTPFWGVQPGLPPLPMAPVSRRHKSPLSYRGPTCVCPHRAPWPPRGNRAKVSPGGPGPPKPPLGGAQTPFSPAPTPGSPRIPGRRHGIPPSSQRRFRTQTHWTAKQPQVAFFRMPSKGWTVGCVGNPKSQGVSNLGGPWPKLRTPTPGAAISKSWLQRPPPKKERAAPQNPIIRAQSGPEDPLGEIRRPGTGRVTNGNRASQWNPG